MSDRARQRDRPDRDEVGQGEVQADREKQQDDPDLGELVGHFLVSHEPWCEGADQDAGEQIADQWRYASRCAARPKPKANTKRRDRCDKWCLVPPAPCAPRPFEVGAEPRIGHGEPGDAHCHNSRRHHYAAVAGRIARSRSRCYPDFGGGRHDDPMKRRTRLHAISGTIVLGAARDTTFRRPPLALVNRASSQSWFPPQNLQPHTLPETRLSVSATT